MYLATILEKGLDVTSLKTKQSDSSEHIANDFKTTQRDEVHLFLFK